MVLEALQAKMRSETLTRQWLREEHGQAQSGGEHSGAEGQVVQSFGRAIGGQHQTQGLAQLQQGIHYMIQDYCHLKQQNQQQHHQHQHQLQPSPVQALQSLGHLEIQTVQPLPNQHSQALSKPSKKRPRKSSRQLTRDPAVLANRPLLKNN
eukprot:COSAG03_NODE_5860_length_1160_cov_0.735156_1_plen_150_part_10